MNDLPESWTIARPAKPPVFTRPLPPALDPMSPKACFRRTLARGVAVLTVIALAIGLFFVASVILIVIGMTVTPAP